MVKPAFAWKMEADKVTVNNTTGGVISSFNFRQSYTSPPLVFSLATDTGGDPSAIRITNVTTTGFDIYSVEPQGEDGPHARMTSVPYIAIEAGSHEFPDGTKIVAGTVNTQRFQSSLLTGSSWQNVTLSGFTKTPTVLGQIQTSVNEATGVPDAPSDPWMTTKINVINSSSFDIALERSETTTGTISSNETIAYLAIDSGLSGGNHYFGSNDASKIEFESIRSDSVIQGWDDSATGYVINFASTYTDPIVVGTMNTRNGPDGGWFRRRSISGGSIALVIDEDQANDSERNHTTERAGILLFSEPFDAEFIYTGQAELIINEVMYNESVTGTNNDEFVELYVTASGNLKGTIISDQDTHSYNFPSHNVSAGDYVIFHTGNGTDNSSGGVHHFYQSVSNIWNNTNDDVLLLKPSQDVTETTDNRTFNATPFDYMAYGRSSVGGNIDAIPTSVLGITTPWSYTFGNELGGAGNNESVALTPNSTDSNGAACWERTTSGNAANNSCTGYLLTVDTTATATVNSEGSSNTASPIITLSKALETIYDPYNGASNPKSIPGAVIEYIITADNSGDLAADDNSISLSDIVPTNTKLCVSDTGNCKAPYFAEGSPASGLTLSGITYGGTSYSAPPAPDVEGTDSRIENMQAMFSGSFPANTEFEFRFRVVID